MTHLTKELPYYLQIYKLILEEARTVDEIASLLELDPVTVYRGTKALQLVGLADVIGTKKTHPVGNSSFLWKASK